MDPTLDAAANMPTQAASPDLINQWSLTLQSSFQDMWHGVINTVPNIIAAVVIFVIGWVVGDVLGDWVAQLIKSVRLDKALQSLGIDEIVAKSGHRLDSGAFIGGLVKWFVIIVFLITALDVVHLNQVTAFLEEVLNYIPNVIVAAVVLLGAAVLSDWLKKVITGSTRAMGITSAELLGGIARWAVWIFAFLIALYQLGIADPFAQTLFIGVVAMLALAGGLAFGLGGRDAAARFIANLQDEISSSRR